MISPKEGGNRKWVRKDLVGVLLFLVLFLQYVSFYSSENSGSAGSYPLQITARSIVLTKKIQQSFINMKGKQVKKFETLHFATRVFSGGILVSP
ncbi:MAG: hypothetical protein HDT26_13710 [Subdoligranulum sp.]|nr:hypothetical protein [Subdoligranulum sp.]